MHLGITNIEFEIMNHNVLKFNIVISYISLSFVEDLFRDYQGHIQNEISIVEFYEHQNWLFSCKCSSYDKRTFILNADKYL